MKFKIGERVVHDETIKVIKKFCKCCSSGRLFINSNVHFTDGTETTGGYIKKIEIGQQLEFDFM